MEMKTVPQKNIWLEKWNRTKPEEPQKVVQYPNHGCYWRSQESRERVLGMCVRVLQKEKWQQWMHEWNFLVWSNTAQE